MKPMLAKKHDGQDPMGWWMSEKLDGVRAIWDGEKLLSRSGKTFCAPGWFINDLPKDIVLDGELWEGRGLFQQTVGKVRTKIDPDWNGIRYVLFDCIGEGSFAARIRKLYQADLPDHVEILEQIPCSGMLQLLNYERKIIKLKGEGVMLRKPLSLYEHKRSSALLKVKRMQTDEALVIDYETGKGRNAGRVGALLCKFRDKIISIGSGLTDTDRDIPPAKGSMITFSFFELTERGMPRFPSFIAVRDYE